MISVGGNLVETLHDFKASVGDGRLLIGFPYLIRYKNSLVKNYSFNYSCLKLQSASYFNYLRTKPCELPVMAVVTASVRLGTCFAFLTKGKNFHF